MKRAENIEKRLKDHDRLCKMHEYSLGWKRYCSCGRDAAQEELKDLYDDRASREAFIHLLNEACEKSGIDPEGLTDVGKLDFMVNKIKELEGEG